LFKYYGSKLIFLIFLALALELKVLPMISIRGAQPDLFFILIAFYGFYIYPSRTLHFAVLLGILKDFFSGTVFGLETLAYGISGLLLWLLVQKMERENLYNQGLLLLLFSFVNLLVLGVLSIIVTENSLTPLQVVLKSLSVSVYTCLLGPFLFDFLRRFLKMNEKDLFGSRVLGQDL